MSVGKRIRYMRKKCNLTQGELAKKVNVSSQVISNWERGYTGLDHDDVARLAEALDCSADYILGKTDDPERITQNNENDIYKAFIESDAPLEFDGKPASEETIEIFTLLMQKLKNATPDDEKFILELLKRFVAGDSAQNIKKDIDEDK